MTAARILGIGRTKAYELARHGEFPCRVIRIGDLYRVSTADLLRLLGVSATNADAPLPSPRESYTAFSMKPAGRRNRITPAPSVCMTTCHAMLPADATRLCALISRCTFTAPEATSASQRIRATACSDPIARLSEGRDHSAHITDPENRPEGRTHRVPDEGP